MPSIRAIERFLRPRDWFPYLGLPVLGWLARGGGGIPWASLLWSLLYLAAGYGFNTACDAVTDRPGKNPVAGGGISRRAAAAVSLGMFAAAGSLAALRFEGSRLPAFSMILLGIVYSLPRMGIKRVPVLGTLANLWLFIPLFWVGADLPPFKSAADAWLFALLGLPSLQSQLIHEALDEDEDAPAGVRTTAQWVGSSRVPMVLIALSAGVIAVAAGAWRDTGIGGIVAGAFIAAAVAAGIPEREGEKRFLRWRRRIQLAYLLPCLLWLAGLVAARVGG